MLLTALYLNATLQVSAPIPSRMALFEVAEFEVTGAGTFQNPFDPNEVAIDGTFTDRKGDRIVLPAYWDGKGFRLRFCPTASGSWNLSVSMRANSRETKTERSFEVAPSHRSGFLKVSLDNPRYFCFVTHSYLPIGLNLCWPDKRGMAGYDERFEKLRSVGGNFARIWTTQERKLETKAVGIGRYDTSAADYYDQIFHLADQHQICTMWTLDDYRVLAKTDYFNAHWADSPYNEANGGPLKEPIDFFANAECRKLYKQRLRYLVARYSAFTSLGVWELYNEQDNIPKPGVPIDWFREMTDYLASIDPYRHPISTSYSWDDKAEVWQSPSLGLTQRHLYGQGDTVDFVSMIQENAHKLDRYGKPRMIGEFGITWKEPDIALDKAKLGTPLHDALWASLMTGDAGCAMTWWWDNYLEPLNLWPVFVGISKFAAPIDFAHRQFRPVALHAQGLTAIGLQDYSTGETIAWLHDPASTWKADAEGVQPKTWSAVQISVPSQGAVSAQFWDTRSGKITRKESFPVKDGQVTIVCPEFSRDIAMRLVRKR